MDRNSLTDPVTTSRAVTGTRITPPESRTFKPYVYHGTGEDTLTPDPKPGRRPQPKPNPAHQARLDRIDQIIATAKRTKP